MFSCVFLFVYTYVSFLSIALSNTQTRQCQAFCPRPKGPINIIRGVRTCVGDVVFFPLFFFSFASVSSYSIESSVITVPYRHHPHILVYIRASSSERRAHTVQSGFGRVLFVCCLLYTFYYLMMLLRGRGSKAKKDGQSACARKILHDVRLVLFCVCVCVLFLFFFLNVLASLVRSYKIDPNVCVVGVS